MSPLSVGLAEVDQRLRSLRRRLNDFTLLHTLCLVLSALTFVSAALILLAMLASANAFRMGVMGACALIATVLMTAGVYLRRQWLDLSAAAWVVDRRAALTDRLTTLAALHAQPRPSRLLPILVQQTLALGSRWQPRHIQPRRVPRSAFVLLVALLALASTGFVSRHIPPPPPPSEIAPQGPPQPVRGPQNEPPQSSKPQRKSPEQGGQPVAADAPELGDDAELDAADGEPGKSRDGRGGDHGRPLSLAALPDRLQQAIRQTFKAEPADQARPLGGGSQADMEAGEAAARQSPEH